MDTLKWQVCVASTVVHAFLVARGPTVTNGQRGRFLEGGSADELQLHLGGRHCFQALVAAHSPLHRFSETAQVAEAIVREECWRHAWVPLTEGLQGQAGGRSAGVLSEALH